MYVYVYVYVYVYIYMCMYVYDMCIFPLRTWGLFTAAALLIEFPELHGALWGLLHKIRPKEVSELCDCQLLTDITKRLWQICTVITWCPARCIPSGLC